MTLNFETEYEGELPFQAQEIAKKVFTFTMDYLLSLIHISEPTRR